MSNSDKDHASDVVENLSKRSDQLEKESVVVSTPQGAQIENVIEKSEIFNKETKVDENSDTIAGIATAILLDSISTNSGING